jgi:DNA invertase Pin-like site-specific DNA recombinase
MFIRAYLRASTVEQDANRARAVLDDFAEERGHKIASYHPENESGATLTRPKLFELLDQAHPGDILLVEQVDRLSRLTQPDWEKLRALIKAKEVKVVALDLPTSHPAMKTGGADTDEFTARMLDAVNNMLLDMLAAVAHKDYQDRRRRQAEGIQKAKAQGAYKGRGVDQGLHDRILELVSGGKGIRATARFLDVSTNTVTAAIKRAKAAE